MAKSMRKEVPNTCHPDCEAAVEDSAGALQLAAALGELQQAWGQESAEVCRAGVASGTDARAAAAAVIAAGPLLLSLGSVVAAEAFTTAAVSVHQLLDLQSRVVPMQVSTQPQLSPMHCCHTC